MERTGGSAAVIFAHPAFFSYLAMFKLTFDMKRLIITLTAAAIVFSCSDRTTSDGISVIDADLTGKEVIELNLADLKKTALEYSDESIIGYATNFLQAPHGYILKSSSGNTVRLMYFDREGQYICDISHQGRGPGEFLDVSSIYMTGDTLTVASFYDKEKLLRYLITPDGYEPLAGVSIKQLNWGISKIFSTPDIPGRYFVKNTWNGTPGWTTPLFTIYDKDWNIVDTCRTKHPEGGYASSYPISHAGDRIYLNQAYSDTIYVAYKDRIDPALIIDFGQSDYPADIKYNVMKRYEFIKAHPDAPYLMHNGSMITADKAYLYLSSAQGPYILVYDMAEDTSTFYRIMDEDGDAVAMSYIFASPDGKINGIFQSVSDKNPAVYDISSL